MKFRPQMQLRFRDERQYSLVKKLAEKEKTSVNNWVLLQAEKLHPELTEPAKSALQRVLALQGSLSHVEEDIESWWIEEKRKEREREEAEVEV